ncbi:MAG: hypothetical protein M3O33_19585 [Cyanobacteriota bacterium]|nr:hypothetical protein [Cyanobacteriota bacterium]
MKNKLQLVTIGFDILILSKLPKNQQDELILITEFLLRQQELEAAEDSQELERRKSAMDHYFALLEQIKSLKSSQ